jgi:hypothetical protein
MVWGMWDEWAWWVERLGGMFLVGWQTVDWWIFSDDPLTEGSRQMPRAPVSNKTPQEMDAGGAQPPDGLGVA